MSARLPDVDPKQAAYAERRRAIRAEAMDWIETRELPGSPRTEIAPDLALDANRVREGLMAHPAPPPPGGWPPPPDPLSPRGVFVLVLVELVIAAAAGWVMWFARGQP